VVTHPEKGDRAAFSELKPKGSSQGRKAGQNNRSLALHNISMKGNEMGTISDDGSHLCFCKGHSLRCHWPAASFASLSLACGVIYLRCHSLRCHWPAASFTCGGIGCH